MPLKNKGLPSFGRGYDLGQRPNPEKDLNDAGVEGPMLSWLIGAKGLKGIEAKTYLAATTGELRRAKITRKQQYNLFIPVYETMKNEVVRISNSEPNSRDYGALVWDSIDVRIRDVVVDLIYRGDYGVVTRRFVQSPFVKNRYSDFKSMVSDRANWQSVPADRFKKRKEYLE